MQQHSATAKKWPKSDFGGWSWPLDTQAANASINEIERKDGLGARLPAALGQKSAARLYYVYLGMFEKHIKLSA